MVHCLLGHPSFPCNTLTTSVCRKYTHTDQYLYWDCHYGLCATNSVFNNLILRAMVVCYNQQLLKEEQDHIRKAHIGTTTPHGP